MDYWEKRTKEDMERIENALHTACKKLESEDIEGAIPERMDIFRDNYKRGWLSRMDVSIICQHISTLDDELELWGFLLDYRQIFNK